MVARPACSLSRTPGGAIAESVSSHDGPLLVHQQLLRSADRRGACTLSHRRGGSLPQCSERWCFFAYGGVFLAPLFVVFLLRGCYVGVVGARRGVGTLSGTTFSQ